MGYRICPECGARLDPAEICDCWQSSDNVEKETTAA